MRQDHVVVTGPCPMTRPITSAEGVYDNQRHKRRCVCEFYPLSVVTEP